MLFVLTTAGQTAVQNAPGNLPVLGSFKLGSGLNYIPSSSDTNIRGTQVYAGVPSAPSIESSNVLRFTVYLDYEVGPFSFGELGLFLPDGTLFALGARSTLLDKIKRGPGTDGNSLTIDCFIPVASVLGYGALSNSSTSFAAPRAESIDTLPPASEVSSNVYIVPSPLNDGTATIAYEESGLWNFSQYQVFSGQGVVVSATGLTVTLGAAGPTVSAPGKAVVVFTSGLNRGVARVVSAYNPTTFTYTFVNPLVNVPAATDRFNVYTYGATGTGTGGGAGGSTVNPADLVGLINAEHLSPALSELVGFITAGAEVAGSVNNRLAAEANNRIAALNVESLNRTQAVSVEAANRQASLDALAADLTAQLGAINTSLATQLNVLAAQTRGVYPGTDINQVTSGLFYQERVARTTATNALAQQITLLSAGAGEQFDPFKIYYYDNSVEGWTGNGVPTAVSGFLRIANHATDAYVQSPAGLAIDSGTYSQVRLRARKIGTPAFSGTILWKRTTDTTWDGARSVVLVEPTFDSNGIGLVTAVVPWDGTIDQIRVKLSVAQTATDGFELDWVAIGRPSPGASSAALLEEQLARAAADSSEVTARQTLSSKVLGTTDPNSVTLGSLSSGLLFDERQARSTADSTEVTARQSLSAKLTGANDPTGLTLATLSSGLLYDERQARVTAVSAEASSRQTLATKITGAADPSALTLGTLSSGLIFDERQARSTADSTEVTARQALSAKITGVNDPNGVTLATLSSGLIYDERQARVTADSAAASRLDALEATVNNPTTGTTATANALDLVELAVNHATTGNSALGTRLSSIETIVNDPTTGVLASSNAIDAVKLAVNNGTTGNSALGTRLSGLESTVNNATTGVVATANALDLIETVVNNGTTGVNALATRTQTLESKVGALRKWSNTVTVNGSATTLIQAELTMPDGATPFQNPDAYFGTTSKSAVSYKVSARAVNTSVLTGAVSVFKISWTGSAWVWSRTVVYEANTVSENVQLYLDAGVPKVRLYSSEASRQVVYDVEASLAGYASEADIVTNYYTKAAADVAIASSVNTVASRLNAGGDTYNSIVSAATLAQSALDGNVTQASQITALDSRVTRSSGGNLVTNPSFEQYTGTTNLADGWAVYNNSSGTEPATTTLPLGRTGGFAQRVSWSVANTTSKGISLPTAANPWKTNTTYVLSFYARAGGGSEGRPCALGWNTAPTTTTTIANPNLSSTLWQRYAFRITWGTSVEANGRFYLTLQVNSGTVGYIEFDDVMVEEGDSLNAYQVGVSELRSAHAGIRNEETTRIAQDTALSNRISTVETSLATGGTTFNSIVSVDTKAQTALDNTTTQASQITQVQSRIDATVIFDAKLNYSFTNTVDGWTSTGVTLTPGATSLTLTYTAANGAFFKALTGSEQFLGASYTKVRVRARRISGTGAWEGAFYYTTAGHTYTTSFYKTVPAPTNAANWNVYEWDMSALTVGGTDWVTSTITGIRIDFVSTGTDVWEVDWVAIGGTPSNAASEEFGALSSSVTQEISTRASETGYLAARYSLNIDVGGKIGGMQITGTSSGTAGAVVNVDFRSDKFTISAPNGTAGVPSSSPFEVVTTSTTVNGVTVPAGVYINDANIKTLKANKIEAGSITATGYLQSPNFIAGSTGWRISGDGSAEFAAATIRGRLTVSQLAIQDFTNLAANGDFALGGEGWGSQPAGVTPSNSAGGGYGGSNFFVTVGPNAAVRNYISNSQFACVAGDIFVLSWAGKVSAALTGTVSVEVNWLSTTGGNLSTSSVGTLTNQTTYTVFTGQVTAPANATRGYVYIKCANTANTASVSTINLRRALSNDQVVDGSMPGNKLQAESVTVTQIDTRGLTIKDGAGNVIFSAGQNLDWGRLTNQPQNIYNNLVDPSNWAAGVDGWTAYGLTGATNTIVYGTGPKGQMDRLWDVTSAPPITQWHGGYRSPVVPVSDSKVYRVVVPFIRLSASTESQLYFGIHQDATPAVTNLNTTTNNTNPYYASSGVAAFTQNVWHYAVGYIYPAGLTGLTNGVSGIYRCDTGALVTAGTAYNWRAGVTSFSFRTGVYTVAASTAAHQFRFGRPMFELVDGTEVALESLLANSAKLNSAISINADGTLSNAGAGAVTITGLGYQGDLNATNDLAMVASTGMLVKGNTLTKTAATSAWDEGAHSKVAFKDGAYVSCTITVSTGSYFVGLNSDPAADFNYTGIDYAWYFSAGVAQCRVPGTTIVGTNASYVVGDVFTIQYDGSKVLFIKNNTVHYTHTSGVTAGQTLYLDTSFFVGSSASSVGGLRFGPLSNNAWSQIGNRPRQFYAAARGSSSTSHPVDYVYGVRDVDNATTLRSAARSYNLVVFNRADASTKYTESYDVYGGTTVSNQYPINYLLYSEAFDNAAWVLAAPTPTLTLTPGVTLENGTTGSVWKITESTTSSDQVIYQSLVFSAAGTRMFYMDVKAAERSFFRLSFATSGIAIGVKAIFDVTTGTIATAATATGVATSPGASITPLGNGWYRCAIWCTFPAAYTLICALAIRSTNSEAQYAGTAGSGLYIERAQVSPGTTVKKYRLTTTAIRYLDSQALAEDLNETTSADLVVVSTGDEPLLNRMTNGLPDAIYRCGGSAAIFGQTAFKSRGAYILIGIPGCGESNGFESYAGDVTNDPDAWCVAPFTLFNGQLSVGSTGANPRSVVDLGYTGDLNATFGADWSTNVVNVPYETIFNNDDSVAMGFNPTFDWPSGSYPTKWAIWAGAAPTKETVDVRVGKYAVRWVAAGEAALGMVANTSFTTSPLPVGTFLAGSIDMKLVSRTSGLPGIMIRLFTSADSVSFTDTRVQPPSTTTGVWQRVPWVARVATTAQIYRIQIYVMASWTSFVSGVFTGTVIYDNMRFMLADATIDNKSLSLTDTAGSISINGGGTGSVTAVTPNNKITSANVGTYMAAAAIGDAYIGNFIKSTNFNGTIDSGTGAITAVGTTGWAISKTGSMVVDAAYVRGKLTVNQLEVESVQLGQLGKGLRNFTVAYSAEARKVPFRTYNLLAKNAQVDSVYTSYVAASNVVRYSPPASHTATYTTNGADLQFGLTIGYLTEFSGASAPVLRLRLRCTSGAVTATNVTITFGYQGNGQSNNAAEYPNWTSADPLVTQTWYPTITAAFPALTQNVWTTVDLDLSANATWNASTIVMVFMTLPYAAGRVWEIENWEFGNYTDDPRLSTPEIGLINSNVAGSLGKDVPINGLAGSPPPIVWITSTTRSGSIDLLSNAASAGPTVTTRTLNFTVPANAFYSSIAIGSWTNGPRALNFWDLSITPSVAGSLATLGAVDSTWGTTPGIWGLNQGTPTPTSTNFFSMADEGVFLRHFDTDTSDSPGTSDYNIVTGLMKWRMQKANLTDQIIYSTPIFSTTPGTAMTLSLKHNSNESTASGLYIQYQYVTDANYLTNQAKPVHLVKSLYGTYVPKTGNPLVMSGNLYVALSLSTPPGTLTTGYYYVDLSNFSLSVHRGGLVKGASATDELDGTDPGYYGAFTLDRVRSRDSDFCKTILGRRTGFTGVADATTSMYLCKVQPTGGTTVSLQLSVPIHSILLNPLVQAGQALYFVGSGTISVRNSSFAAVNLSPDWSANKTGLSCSLHEQVL